MFPSNILHSREDNSVTSLRSVLYLREDNSVISLRSVLYSREDNSVTSLCSVLFSKEQTTRQCPLTSLQLLKNTHFRLS